VDIQVNAITRTPEGQTPASVYYDLTCGRTSMFLGSSRGSAGHVWVSTVVKNASAMRPSRRALGGPTFHGEHGDVWQQALAHYKSPECRAMIEHVRRAETGACRTCEGHPVEASRSPALARLKAQMARAPSVLARLKLQMQGAQAPRSVPPAPPPEPVVPVPVSVGGSPDSRWVTGPNTADRSGLAGFTHIIRSPDDPERTDIRKLPEALRDRAAEWRRRLKKSSVGDWKRAIWTLLSDGAPRTFNRIGVELADKTADLLLGLPPDRALWALVAEGRVEHTMVAPILFRARAGATPPVDDWEPAQPVDDADEDEGEEEQAPPDRDEHAARSAVGAGAPAPDVAAPILAPPIAEDEEPDEPLDVEEQALLAVQPDPEIEALAAEPEAPIPAKNVGRADYEQRRQARIERLHAAGKSLLAQADDAAQRSNAISERFAGGQPIILGHHSTKRALRDKKRMHDLMGKAIELRELGQRYVSRAKAAEQSTAISSDNPAAPNLLREKLEGMRRLQAQFRAINKAMRGGGLLKKYQPKIVALFVGGPPEHQGNADPARVTAANAWRREWAEAAAERSRAELEAVGLPFDLAVRMLAKVLKPDFANRIGVADHELSNTSAEIRRLEKRLATLEGQAARGAPEPVTIGDAEVRWDTDDNRVRITFPGRVSKDAYEKLTGRGFKRAPSAGEHVWQRLANDDAWSAALYLAREIAGVTEKGAG
jgi:hypothetical protein